LVSADDGAIGNGGGFVYVDPQFSKELCPDILLRPVSKPVVDALPVAESLGKVTPLDARLRAEDHCVDEQTIAACRLTTLRTSWQQRLQSSPLLVCKRVALHEQL